MIDAERTGVLLHAALPRGRFHQFTIECTDHRRFSTPGEVWSALRAVGPCFGWWTTTGRYHEHVEAPMPVTDPGEAPIAGEWLDLLGLSWRLQQEADGWSLRRFERSEAKQSVGLVQDHLVDGRPEWRIRYELAWRPARDVLGDIALRPSAARFAGFFRAEENEQ